MKKIISILSAIVLLVGCTKDEVKQTPFPPLVASFKANVAGTEQQFIDQISIQSEPLVQGGKQMLRIQGTRKISTDSSTQIRFNVEDFTSTTSLETMTYPLNTNFFGNFIEWRDSPNSTQGKYHFFQSGQLTITKIGADYISGVFQFTYFTFDHYGNKTGEYAVSSGEFNNLKIKRIN